MCINNVKCRCGKWSLFSFCSPCYVCVCVCSDVNKMRCFTGYILQFKYYLYDLNSSCHRSFGMACARHTCQHANRNPHHLNCNMYNTIITWPVILYHTNSAIRGVFPASWDFQLPGFWKKYASALQRVK